MTQYIGAQHTDRPTHMQCMILYKLFEQKNCTMPSVLAFKVKGQGQLYTEI